MKKAVFKLIIAIVGLINNLGTALTLGFYDGFLFKTYTKMQFMYLQRLLSSRCKVTKEQD